MEGSDPQRLSVTLNKWPWCVCEGSSKMAVGFTIRACTCACMSFILQICQSHGSFMADTRQWLRVPDARSTLAGWVYRFLVISSQTRIVKRQVMDRERLDDYNYIL
jgi:hypothetical protein